MAADDQLVWDRGYDVLLTSCWGWEPEHWGTVGWTGTRGLARRDKLLKQLSNPFITVCYVTSNRSDIDPDLKGMIAGFFIVSHETGDRNAFVHPRFHGQDVAKWRHSLRALRAFSYLPEYRLPVTALGPDVLKAARSVAAMGKILTDPTQIGLLRDTPHVEVPVYGGEEIGRWQADDPTGSGLVRGGPAAGGDYVVRGRTLDLPRRLYVLALTGDASGYLGYEATGRRIVKVGLSASPELRRQGLQKAMPRGAYLWRLQRQAQAVHFNKAVQGEMAMKRHLAAHGDWLGSEFYLASDEAVDGAWQLGCEAAGI